MKLWGGRFSKNTAIEAEDFNSSISVDSRLYLQDIEGSKAHAIMLGKCGIISADEAAEILSGLEEIQTGINPKHNLKKELKIFT